MNLKLQLKVLSFLQFCLWGSWLTTLGSYMFVTLKSTVHPSVLCIARWGLPPSLCPRC